jgi:hypothetical protein
MCLFNEFSFVVASDASGKMGWWVIPPSISKALELYRWHNVDDKGQDSVIHAIALSEHLHFLFTADDKGIIKAVYYLPLLEELKIEAKTANKEFFNKFDGMLRSNRQKVRSKGSTWPSTGKCPHTPREPTASPSSTKNLTSSSPRATIGWLISSTPAPEKKSIASSKAPAESPSRLPSN